MNKIDLRENLQRLADGELPQEQRSQILRGIPADSGHWRELALAFVERQILDESLMGTESIGGTSEGVGCDNSGFRLDRQPVKGFGTIRRKRNMNWSAPALWITAIAASLMIGIAWGDWQASGESSQPKSLAGTPMSPLSADSANEDVTPDLEHLGMPLAEALSRAAYPIPVDLRREMMKRGYLITELDQLSKVQLPTGQLVELPVRQVAVTYLGNQTYQ